MNEGEMPVPAQDPTPKKNDRALLFVSIAMVIGLIALIALNMN